MEKKHLVPGTAYSIALIDDEKDLIDILGKRLHRSGYTVFYGSDEKSIHSIEFCNVDVVLLDLTMPKLNGLKVLQIIKHANPLTEVLILTGTGSVNAAVEAMKMGAFSFLTKPCEFSYLEQEIQKAIERKKMKETKVRAVEAMQYLSEDKRNKLKEKIFFSR